jgi:hypothetical protein
VVPALLHGIEFGCIGGQPGKASHQGRQQVGYSRKPLSSGNTMGALRCCAFF